MISKSSTWLLTSPVLLHFTHLYCRGPYKNDIFKEFIYHRWLGHVICGVLGWGQKYFITIYYYRCIILMIYIILYGTRKRIIYDSIRPKTRRVMMPIKFKSIYMDSFKIKIDHRGENFQLYYIESQFR
jgi:hypothetical protein